MAGPEARPDARPAVDQFRTARALPDVPGLVLRHSGGHVGADRERPTGARVGRVAHYAEGIDEYVAHLVRDSRAVAFSP